MKEKTKRAWKNKMRYPYPIFPKSRRSRTERSMSFGKERGKGRLRGEFLQLGRFSFCWCWFWFERKRKKEQVIAVVVIITVMICCSFLMQVKEKRINLWLPKMARNNRMYQLGKRERIRW